MYKDHLLLKLCLEKQKTVKGKKKQKQNGIPRSKKHTEKIKL